MEFALILPVLVALFVGGLDLTRAYMEDQQLAVALSTAAQYAFIEGQALEGQSNYSTKLVTNVTNFLNATTSQMNIPGTATPVVTYNNGETASTCYCLTGTPPAYTGRTCGYSCSSVNANDTSTAGKWVTIKCTWTYTPMLSLANLTYLTGIIFPSVTQSITVRVG